MVGPKRDVPEAGGGDFNVLEIERGHHCYC
jgi:hypothetical protein